MPSDSNRRHPMDWRRIELVEPEMIQHFSRLSSMETFQIVSNAHRTAKKLTAMGVRYEHPEWSDAEINEEVNRRLLDGTN